jgi:hypothetical protein
LVIGFQWLDGSFLEQIEVIEARAPNDLDVVTFCQIPQGMTQATIAANHPDVLPPPLQRNAFKAVYFVDPYFVEIGGQLERMIKSSTYWYSLWSHRRSGTWKGYLQVDLGQAHDAAANAILNPAAGPGGVP